MLLYASLAREGDDDGGGISQPVRGLGPAAAGGGLGDRIDGLKKKGWVSSEARRTARPCRSPLEPLDLGAEPRQLLVGRPQSLFLLKITEQPLACL